MRLLSDVLDMNLRIGELSVLLWLAVGSLVVREKGLLAFWGRTTWATLFLPPVLACWVKRSNVATVLAALVERGMPQHTRCSSSSEASESESKEDIDESAQSSSLHS